MLIGHVHILDIRKMAVYGLYQTPSSPCEGAGPQTTSRWSVRICLGVRALVFYSITKFKFSFLLLMRCVVYGIITAGGKFCTLCMPWSSSPLTLSIVPMSMTDQGLNVAIMTSWPWANIHERGCILGVFGECLFCRHGMHMMPMSAKQTLAFVLTGACTC